MTLATMTVPTHHAGAIGPGGADAIMGASTVPAGHVNNPRNLATSTGNPHN